MHGRILFPGIRNFSSVPITSALYLSFDLIVWRSFLRMWPVYLPRPWRPTIHCRHWSEFEILCAMFCTTVTCSVYLCQVVFLRQLNFCGQDSSSHKKLGWVTNCWLAGCGSLGISGDLVSQELCNGSGLDGSIWSVIQCASLDWATSVTGSGVFQMKFSYQ